MSDQPGPQDPADRRTADRRATDRQGKGPDVFGDLQRWFIRQTAKNMRNQIGGQVRRTLGGGGREHSDVWDTATNEIPPEVGESPECQWCPICRAARRMRDAGPGIGGQLSGASDVVASAVQDAIGALDSLLTKAGGSAGRESTHKDAGSGQSAPRDSARPATATPDSWRERPGLVGLPGGRDSAGAESPGGSPARAGGSSAADQLATEQGTEPDPWGAATEPGDTDQDPGADAQSDGPGHWA
jgi:hypothetical protein